MTRQEHMALEATITKLRERADQLEEDTRTVAAMLARVEDELLDERPEL